MPDQAATKYVTKQTVADYLSLSVRQLDRYISAGQLPAYRLSKRTIRFRLQDADELMASALSNEPGADERGVDKPFRVVTAPTARGPKASRRAG